MWWLVRSSATKYRWKTIQISFSLIQFIDNSEHRQSLESLNYIQNLPPVTVTMLVQMVVNAFSDGRWQTHANKASPSRGWLSFFSAPLFPTWLPLLVLCIYTFFFSRTPHIGDGVQTANLTASTAVTEHAGGVLNFFLFFIFPFFPGLNTHTSARRQAKSDALSSCSNLSLLKMLYRV